MFTIFDDANIDCRHFDLDILITHEIYDAWRYKRPILKTLKLPMKNAFKESLSIRMCIMVQGIHVSSLIPNQSNVCMWCAFLVTWAGISCKSTKKISSADLKLPKETSFEENFSTRVCSGLRDPCVKLELKQIKFLHVAFIL